MDKKTLFLSIKSPEGIMFEGEIVALSSNNEKGNLDVLPMHINFISIIRNSIKIYQKNNKTQEISFTSGVIKVLENKVDVFLGLETLS